MLSLVIPHAPLTKDLDMMLDNCLSKLSGYDELVLVLNDAIGYGNAFNRGFKYAKGDYILGVSNDTLLIKGDIKDMCDPHAVTYSETAQWGCFFCLPRWVLEKVGGFDPRYGLAYYEDDDYLLRLQVAGVPVRRVPGIQVGHLGGVTVNALKASADKDFLMQENRKKFMERREELLRESKYYVPLS